MIVFPYAKINLGLNVVRRREDGYHDLQSVFVPVPLTDVLEAVMDPTLPSNAIVYTRSGSPVPGALEDDLCYKAIRLIQGASPIPGIRLHLHKVIPMGAGLGGGSSDGAHTLKLVNTLCRLGYAAETLHAWAATLGSDCPFFLRDGVQLAEGRGEMLTPFPLDLSGLWLVLIAPGTHVSTALVYRNTRPSEVNWDFATILDRSRMGTWQHTLHNTMEPFVLENHPTVAAAKQALIEQGAVYAAMSGSGSTVFGLFKQRPVLANLPLGASSWSFLLS